MSSECGLSGLGGSGGLGGGAGSAVPLSAKLHRPLAADAAQSATAAESAGSPVADESRVFNPLSGLRGFRDYLDARPKSEGQSQDSRTRSGAKTSDAAIKSAAALLLEDFKALLSTHESGGDSSAQGITWQDLQTRIAQLGPNSEIGKKLASISEKQFGQLLGDDKALSPQRLQSLAGASQITLPSFNATDGAGDGQTVAQVLANAGQPGDSLSGIAITRAQTGGGTWQYRREGGQAWHDVGAVDNANALLLGSQDRLRFVPSGKANVRGDLGFHNVYDGISAPGRKVDINGPSRRGGIGDAEHTATIDVVGSSTDVPSTPTTSPTDNPTPPAAENTFNVVGPGGEQGANSTITINENSTEIFAFGSGRNAGSGIKWAVSDEYPNSDLFEISADGRLSFKNPPNFESPGGSGDNRYVVKVVATDPQTGQRVSQTVSVTVADVKQEPPPAFEPTRVFEGTEGNDKINVRYDAKQNAVVVSVNGEDTRLTPEEARRLKFDMKGGDDVITVDSAADIRLMVAGGEGDDTLQGTRNDDVLLGGSGDDVIDAGSGGDYLDGGAGNDVLRGGAGGDYFIGGGGKDKIWAGKGGDLDTLEDPSADSPLRAGEGYLSTDLPATGLMADAASSTISVGTGQPTEVNGVAATKYAIKAETKDGVFEFDVIVRNGSKFKSPELLKENLSLLPPAYFAAASKVGGAIEFGVSADHEGAWGLANADWVWVASDLDGDLVAKILTHELGHAIADWASRAGQFSSESWVAAEKADGVAVSGYGNTNAAEDLAEFSVFYARALQNPSLMNELRDSSPARLKLFADLMAKVLDSAKNAGTASA